MKKKKNHQKPSSDNLTSSGMIYSGNSSRLSLATNALFQVGSPLHLRRPGYPHMLWSIRNMTTRRTPDLSLTFWEGERQKRTGRLFKFFYTLQTSLGCMLMLMEKFLMQMSLTTFPAKGAGDLSSSTTLPTLW